MLFSEDVSSGVYRRTQLVEYVHSKLLTPGLQFICQNCENLCRPSAERRQCHFAPGAMLHLGSHFHLDDEEGRTFRIAVVGQERASSESHVSMEMRTKAIMNKANGLSTINPHLRGTRDLLSLLFGAGGTDSMNIKAEPRAHVLDAFCLTNATLCSAHKIVGGKVTTKGAPTDTMVSACHDHLKSILQILEPTVLVLQGEHARQSTEQVLSLSLPFDSVIEAAIGNEPVLVCALSHPTSHPSRPGQRHTGWGSANTAYFRETIVPLMNDVRTRLLRKH